ncbi:MAG TPA: hypothetical protein VNN55_00215, partial [bacterium]|nr:hypothetical protein [bacterium]
STTFTYTSFNKLASETSAVGNALVSSDDPVSQQKRVELGFAALVAGLTAADRQALLDLHTTRYTYDARQNLIERRDAGGDITRFEYDAFGNLTRRIVYLDPSDLADPTKQQITRYAYDAFGNNIETTDGEGHVTRSQYDHFGNLTRFTDARGGITTYTYDADHRLLTVTDPEGHVTVNRYDAVGNRIAVTDANGHSVIHLYDRNNLLIATLDNADTNPAQNRDTRFVYDIVGNRTSVTDAEGRTTTYTYNARRELVEVRAATVADEAGVLRQFLTTYAYDGEGNRIRTTNNRGFTTEMLYTPEGLVRQQTDPTGHVTRFVYDANHNQVTIIAGVQLPEAKRQIIRFSYDEEDQLISQTDAQGHTTRYRYDAPGNRAAVTDANGNTTDFEYDKNNRLVKEIRPAVIDPRTGVATRYTVLHQYDANGNEIATTDENGHTTRFTFDKDDRLAMVEDANGLKTVYAYDSRHNRTRVSIGVQAHLDPTGHIVIDSVENAQVTSFVYDEFNQLIAKTDGVAHALTASDSALYRAMRRSLGVVDPLTGEGKSAAQLTEADKQTLQNAFTERYTYDRVGNYLSTTDHLG